MIKTPVNQKNLSVINQAKVLQTICLSDTISRAEIARQTGLTAMTVSNIVNGLINAGIVYERQDIKGESDLGRKPKILDIAETSPCIIGLNLARGSVSAILCDYKARIIHKTSKPVHQLNGADEMFQMLIDTCRQLMRQTNRKIIAVGFSCPGPINTEEGIILDPHNFYELKNIPVAPILQKELNLPIYCVHDSNAAAIGEKNYGCGKHIRDFLYFRLAAGVGCGLILNHQLYNGEMGLSGEIGHTSCNISGPVCTCGNRGCLENYIDTDRITAEINKTHNFNPPLSWFDILTLYNSKQNLFSEQISEFCSYIAFSIVNIVNLLDIHTVILEYPGQTPDSAVDKLIEDKINTVILSNYKRKISVIPTALEFNASLIGAASVIMSKIFSGEIDFR